MTVSTAPHFVYDLGKYSFTVYGTTGFIHNDGRIASWEIDGVATAPTDLRKQIAQCLLWVPASARTRVGMLMLSPYWSVSLCLTGALNDEHFQQAEVTPDEITIPKLSDDNPLIIRFLRELEDGIAIGDKFGHTLASARDTRRR